MRKTLVMCGFAIMLALGTASVALAGVNIYVQPPTPPVVVAPVPPPPAPVVVYPPPPPGIVIAPGPPAYWFWDDGRAEWFYYDAHRHPHFVRDHVYIDDGRHFYREGREWRIGHEDMGRHRGWYKHGRGRGEWRDHDRGRGHGRGHDDER